MQSTQSTRQHTTQFYGYVSCALLFACVKEAKQSNYYVVTSLAWKLAKIKRKYTEMDKYRDRQYIYIYIFGCCWW